MARRLPATARPAPPPLDLAAALALRGWALRALWADGGWEAAPDVDAAAWNTFLAVEQCALPLVERLGPPSDAVDPATARVIRTFATAAQQQLLSAVASARVIGRWTAGSGVPVIVLKGGVAAIEGAPMVGMADLDLLVPPAEVRRVTQFLEESAGFMSDPDIEHRFEGRHHAGPLSAGGLTGIEVHRALMGMGPTAPLLARALPVRGARGLMRLAQADHLVFQLLHGAVQHPERCGGLRDLVLLGHGWRNATAAERDEARARVAVHRSAATLRDVLAMAEEAAGAGPVVDRMRDRAVARYLFHAEFRRRRPPDAIARVFVGAAFAMHGSAADLRALLDEELRGDLPWAVGRWGAHPAARPVVAGVAWLLRAGRLAAVAALALPHVVRVRRAVRRMRAGAGPASHPAAR